MKNVTKRVHLKIEAIDASTEKKHLLLKQFTPVIICAFLFIFFIQTTHLFIQYFINPFSTEQIQIVLYPSNILVGFFLYFVTAVDYALVVGRMQVVNSGFKARIVMNIFTCVGCYVGVSLVLFLWGFAKEVYWILVPLLIFAGAIMLKLAYEGKDYLVFDNPIAKKIGNGTTKLLTILYFPTRLLTAWVPELATPNVQRMHITELAKWSFLLPFIIGLDDFIGYMGAMTIYNVYSLLFGIYIADIVIDLIIFISPKFTKKLVESPMLSLLAAYAFLYLAFKSFSESYDHIIHHLKVSSSLTLIVVGIALIVVMVIDYWKMKSFSSTA